MAVLGINQVWPPTGPVTVLETIPAYPYVNFQGDDEVGAFFTAYNLYAQGYVNWFNSLNLPIYTQAPVSGNLLNWVGQSIYGMIRPGIQSGQAVPRQGPVNTVVVNTLWVNGWQAGTSESFQLASDDYYRRALTWQFYKGDGKIFNPRWLKRRINRFLNGIDGKDVTNDTTFDISVQYTGYKQWTITLPTSPDSLVLQAMLENGALELPIQVSWTVNVV